MATRTVPKSTIDTSPAASGERLKREIHAARARAGIGTDMELAKRSRVSYDTLMNWYSGRTVPRANVVKQVADAVGVKYSTLLDVYEGRDPEPPELKEAIAMLADEIRTALVDERRARAQLMRAVAAAITAAMGDPVGVMAEPLSVPNTSDDGLRVTTPT